MTKEEEFEIIANVIRNRLIKSAKEKFPIPGNYRIKWSDGVISTVHLFVDYVADVDWDNPDDEPRLLKELLAAVQGLCYATAILTINKSEYRAFLVSSSHDTGAKVELID